MTPPEEDEVQLSPEEAERMGALLASALGTSHAASETVAIPDPDDTWPYDIDGVKGTAWVFLAQGHEKLTAPVIVSDGFYHLPSSLEQWSVLWNEDPDDPAGYPWAKDLSDAGKDLIILGYDNRTVSILDNAKIAKACILQAIDEREGDTPLVVGGLSMGGLITRYTLALMEWEVENDVENAAFHETSTYFSYDSPHRGGWVPISVQAFAHFMAACFASTVPAAGGMSAMLKSPAARQMATYHLDTYTQTPEDDPPTYVPQPSAPDPKRTEFLAELRRVGWFPNGLADRPIKRIAVANGVGDGAVRDLPADNKTLTANHAIGWLTVTLYGQKPDDVLLVADLKNKTPGTTQITTNIRTHDIPAPEVSTLDGAPGGTLQSNQLAVDALAPLIPNAANRGSKFPWVCFVPTVSAVDVADPETSALDPIPDDPPEECIFDAYKCATTPAPPSDQNPQHHPHEHTLLTNELCTWLLANFE